MFLMSCYECKYRGTVPGSAHSSCSVIKSTGNEKVAELELLLATGKFILLGGDDKPIVNIDPHGVKHGWGSWPIDFDPVWIRSCGFFTNQNEEK